MSTREEIVFFGALKNMEGEMKWSPYVLAEKKTILASAMSGRRAFGTFGGPKVHTLLERFGSEAFLPFGFEFKLYNIWRYNRPNAFYPDRSYHLSNRD